MVQSDTVKEVVLAMRKVHQRKAGSGSTSYVVTLPTGWVREQGLDKDGCSVLIKKFVEDDSKLCIEKIPN